MSKNFDPQRMNAANQRQLAELLQQQDRAKLLARVARKMLKPLPLDEQARARYGTWTDPGPAPKPAKYRNQRTAYTSPLIGPRTYDSKKEADFAATLDGWRAAGLISFWLRQVRFPIGGGVVHVVDFMTVGKGETTFYETKGRDLQAGRNKRRQTEERYGIKIIVV